MRGSKPEWLKIRPPQGERYAWIRERRLGQGLATVCEEAHCPNLSECWGAGTATFMVMGDTCTRGCRFCAVKTAKQGRPLDPDEPRKLAETLSAMSLDYVVLTSVDRDDLQDQGAGHFAACVRAVKQACPTLLVEVLIPDFRGERACLRTILASGADVVAHNVEVTEALTPKVRDGRCSYRQSLGVLAGLKRIDPRRFTKSSLMVGLGEPEADVVKVMRDLRDVGCDFLTVGQYLRPSAWHLPVEEYVHPDVFRSYERVGRDLGFRYVASGPLVRSSYKAGEFFIRNLLRSGAGDGVGEAAAPGAGTA